MNTRALGAILLRASLIAVPVSACCWMGDDSGTEHGLVTRAEHGDVVDRCIADEAMCLGLCYDVLADETGFKDVDRCEIEAVVPEGVRLEVHWTELCEAGRRPRGLAASARRGDGAGAWLARAAALEAASVTAFARLVRTLTRLGAPRALIASARRAIGDELLHARLVARLARARGATVAAPVIVPVDEPTPAELAHDNAVEGQVAETVGALVATCQARAATDPQVRAVFARIARDETRHAALAHALAPWLERRLGPAERIAVRDARRDAAAAITGDCGLGAADRAALGIPAAAPLRAAVTAAFAALA